MFAIKNQLVLSLLTVIFASLYLAGCAGKAGKFMDSAQANYQVNDYEAALRDTVTALRYNPNYVRAQDFVQFYFKAAVKAEQNKLKMLESSSSELTSLGKFRCDAIVAAYRSLVRINTLVSDLPPLIHKKTKKRITFGIRDYSMQLDEAIENAAEVHYQRGVSIAASSDDVETQKMAAKEFKMVESFVRGYKDAASRYEETRKAGVKRMAILTFEGGRDAHRYDGLLQSITDNIITAVVTEPEANEFLEIIARENIELIMAEQDMHFTGRFDPKKVVSIGEVAGVHELLIGRVTNIFHNGQKTKKSSYDRKVSSRKKIGTEQYVDKNGKRKTRNKYRTVNYSARVTHYQRNASVRIVGSYKILDTKTGKIKSPQRFNIAHEFKAEWGEYTGDEVALERSDKVLINLEEQDAPEEAVMVHEAAEKLADKLAKALIAYAR